MCRSRDISFSSDLTNSVLRSWSFGANLYIYLFINTFEKQTFMFWSQFSPSFDRSIYLMTCFIVVVQNDIESQMLYKQFRYKGKKKSTTTLTTLTFQLLDEFGLAL